MSICSFVSAADAVSSACVSACAEAGDFSFGSAFHAQVSASEHDGEND